MRVEMKRFKLDKIFHFTGADVKMYENVNASIFFIIYCTLGKNMSKMLKWRMGWTGHLLSNI